MDESAMRRLSYGVYVVATYDDEKNVGCVVNTVTQVTANPISIALSLHKNNYTTGAILENGYFTVSVLSENIPQETIGTFGFSSSKDKDKFDHVKFSLLDSDLPILAEGVCAYLECRVTGHTDCHTHTIILADVLDVKTVSNEKPMTYDYYRNVMKGKTPKNASTYQAPKDEDGDVYICSVCGYEYPGTNKDFEDLPDDYRCPICGVPKNKFAKMSPED